MQTIKPPRLVPGDVVGIAAPASPPSSPHKIEQGAAYIEKMGYRVVIGKHAYDADGYLAGSDPDRAADINAMFADPLIKAVFAVRGGYGSPRILDLIDYDIIRKNPKIFVGYSDCTALQCAMYAKAGLVSFSGPMVAVEMQGVMDRFTEENLWRLLSGDRAPGVMPFPAGDRWTAVHEGKRDGILIGGNCTMFLSLLATEYLPETNGAALFLEEIGEKPYRIDRMFAQLRHAGIFRKVSAIVLGSFTDCEAGDSDGPSLTLDRIFSEYFAGLNIPVISGFAYGHQPSKLTVPFGVRARVDTGRGSVELLESPVA